MSMVMFSLPSYGAVALAWVSDSAPEAAAATDSDLAGQLKNAHAAISTRRPFGSSPRPARAGVAVSSLKTIAESPPRTRKTDRVAKSIPVPQLDWNSYANPLPHCKIPNAFGARAARSACRAASALRRGSTYLLEKPKAIGDSVLHVTSKKAGFPYARP